jgi:hypothetical protein
MSKYKIRTTATVYRDTVIDAKNLIEAEEKATDELEAEIAFTDLIVKTGSHDNTV